MLLTSNSFLFYFLPISLISFSVLKLKKKNRIYFLGVLSGYLYMLDNGQLVVVLIFLSLLIKLQLETKIFNNFIFIFIILSPLILFKYLQPILLFFGLSIPELIISNFPIGLSFFTFQGIAYYFDSERNGQKETTFDIFTFLTFFPQLLFHQL